jgi:hypothetical protein
MSTTARWFAGIVLLALGAVLLGAVGTVPGIVVFVIGMLVLPWHPGMGGGAGGTST